MRQFAARLCGLSLLMAGIAMGQSISDVVNAGSRIGSGLPSYGIAKGAIFLVTGQGLGPDQLQQAGFPLPTWDGLGGTSVVVTVGDTNNAAIMVYTSATEVAAILPSATPSGAGTVTVSYNGQAASAPITVVDAAFGIFTQNRIGSGAALAFNATGGDPVPNTLTQPAQSGQAVLLNGTGAGAIASDESQGGVTDPVSTILQVWVGNQPATLISAARGTCCAGLDPSFPIPQGVAGWDVIQFTVPDGVSGCHVPVAVQAGSFVSNFATIAVAPAGTPCQDPNGFGAADLQSFSGPVKMGSITLSRSSTKMNIPGISLDTKSDSGSASFLQYDPAWLQGSSNPLNVSSLGSCLVVTAGKIRPDVQPAWTAPAPLDAGPAINVTGNGATKQMPRLQGGTYSANFGSGMSLPIALPGILPWTPFLEPGAFTADNGSGGQDVGKFTAKLTVPKPLTWTNQDDPSVVAVDRTQGVTVKWSGGDSNSFVTITGTSTSDLLYGSFVCTERVSALQFTVPAVVTLSLPPSAIDSSTGAAVPTGFLNVQSSVSGKFTAPGLDLGYFTSTVAATRNVSYQ